MIESKLFDDSNNYIFVKRAETIFRHGTDAAFSQVVFKSYAPFTDCTAEIIYDFAKYLEV